jgi:hypothetical protein
MEKNSFNLLVLIWMAIALVLFPILLKVTAPYGRHTHRRWGTTIANRFGWIVMEIPALLCFIFFFYFSAPPERGISWIFLLLWGFHYLNRSLIFPLRIKTTGKEMPVIVMLLALVFNFINGSINGYHFGTLNPDYPISWMRDIRFISGSILFIGGMFINWYSDRILIDLRKNNRNGYSIPHGFLFRYISCPNFFGEIVEWAGFALMAWSLPALSFVLWSFTNLVPRALDHHRWYLDTFKDYPKDRKSIIPFLL